MEATVNPFLSATIAMLLVMILAVSSAILVCPLLNKSYSKYILHMLSMLAVGTLSGDAIFHLIPHSLGSDADIHAPDQSNSTVHHHHSSSWSCPKCIIVYKCCLIVGSVYLFYLLNCIMNLSGVGHTHSHGQTSWNKTDSHSPHYTHEAEHLLADDSLKDHSLGSMLQMQENANQERQDYNARELSVGDDFRSLPNIVWMVIASDTLHNITDGLALGASFSSSVSGGLSTAIAILCHEIPHEIGDFVVLLGAGLRIRTALLLTSATYIFSFAGMYAGVLLGDKLNIVDWIFAVTAGMFLYVAFVQVMPDMIGDLRESKDRPSFAFQNAGFLTGTAVMALIAVYEDSIRIQLST